MEYDYVGIEYKYKNNSRDESGPLAGGNGNHGLRFVIRFGWH